MAKQINKKKLRRKASTPSKTRARTTTTMWTLYILRCADDSLYTGITNDIEKRLAAHECGKGAKYTRGRGPFKIVHKERFRNRSNASKREAAIKALSRDEKFALIDRN